MNPHYCFSSSRQVGLAGSLYASSAAGEVYDRLQKLRPAVNRYHASCKPNSLSNYLDYGTLPFALNRPEALLYRDVRTIVDKVLNMDLRDWQNFNAASLTAMPHLLNILATAGDPPVPVAGQPSIFSPALPFAPPISICREALIWD